MDVLFNLTFEETIVYWVWCAIFFAVVGFGIFMLDRWKHKW